MSTDAAGTGAEPARHSPVGAQVFLVVAFVVLAAVGVVTVVVPELRDDAAEEEAAPGGAGTPAEPAPAGPNTP